MVKASTLSGKGRVIDAVADVAVGQILESSPAVALSAADRRAIDHTSLFPYYFVRADKPDVYIIFGLASFCSHADDPNAAVEWRRDADGLWAESHGAAPDSEG